MKFEYVASVNDFLAFAKFRTSGEVCFLGRSNAGKSTLINAVTSQQLAFVSKMPGKTISINLYKSGNFTLSDTPGYGFATGKSVGMDQDWTALMSQYAAQRENLKMAYILIDCRRGIMEIDIDAMLLIEESSLNYTIVYTKLDKITAKEEEIVRHNDKMILGTFKLDKIYIPENGFIATSSAKRIGIKTLLSSITGVLKYQ